MLFFTVYPAAGVAEESGSKRFFLGEKKCRRCHHDPGRGNQFNVWRLSAHARAHAALSRPESDLMARLSGIDGNVFEEPVCLGCHTTGVDSEAWQRNPGFMFEDGIQCEFCHGPGSDYADAAVMADKKAAMAAGLKIPDETVCMNCHEHKGSHQAKMKDGIVQFKHPVKGEVYFDFKKAYKKIDHRAYGKKPGAAPGDEALPRYPETYLGVAHCTKCHNTREDGYLSSRWRLTPHADAYARLATQSGVEIAMAKGIVGNPQESESCLICHTAGNDSSAWRSGQRAFDKAQGVQCESCHGPGVNYATAEIMKDPDAARKAGLVRPDKTDCLRCHNGYHGKDFDFESMVLKIDHSRPVAGGESARSENRAVQYKTPFNLALNRDGTKLFVACEASDSMIVADTSGKTVLAEVPVMNLPHGICLSPDESVVFVSNRGSDTVSVIDAGSYKVVNTIQVGDEPHDLITDQAGETLFVANTGSNDISVVDLALGRETRRLSGGRGTWGMARSPDGASIYVTNNLSHFVDFRTTSISEVTVIDAGRKQVADRIMIPDANLIQGVDFSPDGEFALVTLLRTKNLVPIVRVMQGWMITNGFGILWKDGRVDQLLIDRVDDYFADPTDIAIAPDGRYAFVTGGGVNEVAVLDIAAVKTVLESADPGKRKNVLPNHLGVSESYMVKRIKVGQGPRGLAVSPDGRFVYVADALDDTVSIIDVSRLETTGVIDLGGPDIITQIRKGERIFHNADITYGRQYTCHTCHPDGGIDGLAYDIAPDGLGVNPVDNRTLKGVLDTAPFKWTGKNPSLSRQCGPRLAVFFTRIDPFTPEQARDLESYICTIPRNPNRYLKEGGMTESQQRGRHMFQRTHTNEGKEIPVKDRCDTCHSGPYYTNRKPAEVSADSRLDTHGRFDVPHLNNIYETAPYLHDGRAETLEEIWTRFNPEDKHGVTNDMTKDQLNDLIEYLKIL